LCTVDILSFIIFLFFYSISAGKEDRLLTMVWQGKPEGWLVVIAVAVVTGVCGVISAPVFFTYY